MSKNNAKHMSFVPLRCRMGSAARLRRLTALLVAAGVGHVPARGAVTEEDLSPSHIWPVKTEAIEVEGAVRPAVNPSHSGFE